MPANNSINLIGILTKVYDVQDTRDRRGGYLPLRKIELIDRSGMSIQVALWGNDATNFNLKPNACLVFKNVLTRVFNQKVTLSLLLSSPMQVCCKLPNVI